MRFYKKSSILVSHKFLIVVLTLSVTNSGEFSVFHSINFLLPRDVNNDLRVFELLNERLSNDSLEIS